MTKTAVTMATTTMTTTHFVAFAMWHDEGIGDLNASLDIGAQQSAHHTCRLLRSTLVRVDDGEQDGRMDFDFDWECGAHFCAC